VGIVKLFTRATLAQCVQNFRAEMRRRGWKPNTTQVRYGRELDRFAAFLGPDTDIRKITADHIRDYLDANQDWAEATTALFVTILNSFFKWLVREEVIDVSPSERIDRPKVPHYSDRKRTKITPDQVDIMLRDCRRWAERIGLHVLAYTAVRRNAASELRWKDVDLDAGKIKFSEKGGKMRTLPIFDELRSVLEAYVLEHGTPGPDEFVIPNRRPTGRLTRSNKIVYLLVKQVAARNGIESTVHAFRRAFAVFFLERYPDQIETLRVMLGHESIATTQIYVDEFNAERALEKIVHLSFGKSAEEDLAVSA
jgi:site-specific recombinase XerD